MQIFQLTISPLLTIFNIHTSQIQYIYTYLKSNVFEFIRIIIYSFFIIPRKSGNLWYNHIYICELHSGIKNYVGELKIEHFY